MNAIMGATDAAGPDAAAIDDPAAGATRTAQSVRIAAAALLASGLIGVAAVGFLIAMYIAFGLGASPEDELFGRINDALTVVVYLLLAPGVLSLRALLRPASRAMIDGATVVALVSIAAIAALQVLLVRGELTFEQEIGPVAVAFLALGGWFLVVGRIGRRVGLRTGGSGLAILAALYVGYPVWAIRMARQLPMTASFTSPGGAGSPTTNARR